MFKSLYIKNSFCLEFFLSFNKSLIVKSEEKTIINNRSNIKKFLSFFVCFRSADPEHKQTPTQAQQIYCIFYVTN